MAKEKRPRKIAARRNPLLLGDTPLPLGLDENGDPILSEEQEQDKFMATWMDVFHPYSSWPRIFRQGDAAGERTLRDVKLYFRKYVLEDEWSEKKYVMVVNTLLDNRSGVNGFTLDKMGHVYDEEKLPVQVRLRREQG